MNAFRIEDTEWCTLASMRFHPIETEIAERFGHSEGVRVEYSTTATYQEDY
jgi:hypothetical protein